MTRKMAVWGTECHCGKRVNITVPDSYSREQVVEALNELGWAVNRCPEHNNKKENENNG